MDQNMEQRLKAWREAVRHGLNNPSFGAEPAYLFDPMVYALKGEGKLLRSALCLAASEAVGGTWEEAVKVGVALEIFHTFTLIHDDIMDGDELRRGIPTVHKAFDKNSALLAGDTLLIYVYQSLAEIEGEKFKKLFKAFNAGAMDVCMGQAWDMQFERSSDINPEQYEMMIDLKTGALVKLACQLGGIIGGGSDGEVEILSRYGLLLGRAFQMQDDLLELTSSAETMGKSLGSDLMNEKKTWIWLDLEKNLTPPELEQWQAIKNSGQLSNDNREQLRLWMSAHGTLNRAQALVEKWVSEADQLLSSASFSDTSMLKLLKNIILNRQS